MNIPLFIQKIDNKMIFLCSQTVTYCYTPLTPLTSVIPTQSSLAFAETAFPEMMTFEAIPYKYSPDSTSAG